MKNELVQIKDFLDFKYDQYNRIDFISDDPVSIPHLFSRIEDIEIAGFLSSVLSWGKRQTIIAKATALISLMDYSPYEFVIHASEEDLRKLEGFKHRTFNGTDCQFFIRSLKNIYLNHGGLERCFANCNNEGIKSGIGNFRRIFFSIDHPERSRKHIPDPFAGSSAKRINMFLRWMVRNDNRGVDFGIWKSVSPSQLVCPLDIHTGNVARKLALINRRQNDWKAVEELMSILRQFDAHDPVKYDFALFGLGIFEKF